MKRRLPARLSLLAALLLALAVCAGAAAPEVSGPFSDVPADAWYADAVAEACALGLMRGTSRDTFSPDQLVTPVEAATVLYRLAGSPGDAPPAPGVLQDAWYAPALNWYETQDIFHGMTGGLLGGVPLDREYAASMFCRYAGCNGLSEQLDLAFETVWEAVLRDNSEDWNLNLCLYHVKWCITMGILRGDGQGCYRLGSPITRAELAAMAVRMVEALETYDIPYGAALCDSAAPAENLDATPWPEFLAGPTAGGYTVRSEALGCSFTVPAAVSQKVAVASGVRSFDPEGTCLTLYYVPEGGRYPLTMFYLVAEAPRADFFKPGSWYYSAPTNHPIAAVGEDSIYFTMGPLGGSEIGRDDPLWEDYTETFSTVSAAIRETIAPDAPSSLPVPDTAAMAAAADALADQGDKTLTRAAAAQLAYSLLATENKETAYPVPYTDVASGTEAARAIAYLSSYGLLTRYARDGTDLDGTKFRPGEAITRGEFTMLLHRLSFQPSPEFYYNVPAGMDLEHWASGYVIYGWICGWLEADGSDLRPDDPITCAKAAQVLRCVAEDGYPIPGVDK